MPLGILGPILLGALLLLPHLLRRNLDLGFLKILFTVLLPAGITCGLAALIFSIRALRKVKKDEATVGKGIAAFSLVLGVVTLLFGGALSASLAYSYSKKLAGERRRECRKQMEKIAQAAHQYLMKEGKKEHYPRSLGDLVKSKHAKAEWFICPSDSSPQTLKGGLKSSYESVFERYDFQVGKNIKGPRVLMWEHPSSAHEGEVHIVFFVGNSDRMQSKHLPAFLKKQDSYFSSLKAK
ncbi:MAG: DUF4190 domain-containing protein [Planctomycetota bacterium]|nr:DUF4190 domain-containing protein [Planctomycetota bacterium]